MDHQMRRIGVIAPPANVALERELPRYLPEGFVLNHNRLSRPEAALTKESLIAMGQSATRAARDLAMARPEVMVYACTSGSFLDGLGNEARIADHITEVTGVPAVTTSTAVIEALRALSAATVFMVTPYPNDVNEHEVAFLAYHGIQVAGFDSFYCRESADILAISSEQVAELVLRHRSAIGACDAVFVSCTNLLVMDQVERLEGELGIPLVTSNQASLWAALTRLDAAMSEVPCGRLFKTEGRRYPASLRKFQHSRSE